MSESYSFTSAFYTQPKFWIVFAVGYACAVSVLAQLLLGAYVIYSMYTNNSQSNVVQKE